MTDISKLTKVELEELGREHGIELDRRLTKSTLIEQLEEVITEEPSSMADLKAEYVEEAPVLKEVVPAPSGQLLTERTKPAQIVDKLFADADGNVLKFETREAARSTGHRYDGKVLEENGHFVVRKY